MLSFTELIHEGLPAGGPFFNGVSPIFLVFQIFSKRVKKKSKFASLLNSKILQ